MIAVVAITVMVVTVVFMIPVAFVHAPTSFVVIVVRMTPISPGIWGLLPTTRHPDIASISCAPISVGPDKARVRRWWTPLITDGWRC